MDVRILDTITDVDPMAWDHLAGTRFPFASYHFLRALETTECLGERTGWYPAYLVVHRGPELIGALICFVKTNGYGEYIFDWAWAEGAHAAGLAYYPKLTSAIPFTPATGTKLLLSPVLDQSTRAEVRTRVYDGLRALAARVGASSTHALFVPPDEVPRWTADGFVARDSYQFHWHNRGYRDFDHFLAALKSKRRREIRRERTQARAGGVRITRLSGAALTPDHARAFHEFYVGTTSKRGGYEYLTLQFFVEVFKRMPERLLLVWAEDAGGVPVAGALNYLGDDTLFGRHWGARAEYRALHFELCYYQGLEFAIERGLARFEAGAQGEHKLQRGFTATRTYSAHRIAHAGLAEAVRNFIARESERVAAEIDELNAHAPFGYGESLPGEAAR